MNPLTPLNDLSYSGLSQRIQHDESEAAAVLYTCAMELEDIAAKREKLHNELNNLDFRKSCLIRVGEYVAKHMKKSLPLMVVRDKSVVVITNDNLKIERNTI